MIRLQIQLFGPYFSSFSAHSYGYEPSNELKSVLKHPNFRIGPYSPTGSWQVDEKPGFSKLIKNVQMQGGRHPEE
jgi:hypothetical protein